ncbi:MAG: hypothetical protein RLZZ426_566 [Actinomycetota bacterium]
MTESIVREWWEESEGETLDPISVHHYVTAIVVSRNGAKWLPQTLSALRFQTRQADRIAGIDLHSTDGSLELMHGSSRNMLCDQLAVGTSLGEAITHATSFLDEQPRHAEWLWILHDDSAPDPHALASLLAAADTHPHAAVVGCKLVDWVQTDHVLEVGSSITAIGTRFTGLEHGERDQGQHDEIHEVHSVSSAGMLVRREVWRSLGGFSEELPHFRNDLDFCWRVWASGNEVIVAPEARVRHVSATARELRPVETEKGTPHFLDRRAGILVVLSRTSRQWLWARIVLLVLIGLARAGGYLLLQDIRGARSEIRATTSALTHRVRLKNLRAGAGLAALPGGIRPPVGEQISHVATEGLTAIQMTWNRILDSLFPQRLHTDEVGFGMAAFALLRRPGAILSVVTLLAGLVITRDAWATGQLVSPIIGVTPDSAQLLWNEFLSGWHRVGMGSDMPSHPMLAFISLMSVLTGGNAVLAVVALCAAGAFGAALSMHLSLRSVLPHAPTRVWLAALYGLSPVVVNAMYVGDIGLILAAIVLPIAVVLIRHMATSWRSAAGAGVAIAALASVWVTTWWIAITVLVLYIVSQKPSRAVIYRAVAALAWSITLLMPWSLHVLMTPGAWFSQFSVTSETPAEGWRVLVASASGSQLTGWYWSVGLLIMAIVASQGRRNLTTVLAMWKVVGVVSAIVVVGQMISTFTVYPIEQPSVGVGALIVNGALIVCLANIASTLKVRLVRSNFGWLQIGTAMAIISITLMPIASIASVTVGSNVTEALHRQTPITPEMLRGFSEETYLRTLFLKSNDATLDAQILDGRIRTIGDLEVSITSDKERLTAQITKWLTGATLTEQNPLLPLGVGYIAVPFGDPLATRIAGLGNLERLITARNDQLIHVWRVTEVGSRAYIGDGMELSDQLTSLTNDSAGIEVRQLITARTEESVIHLSERVSDGWSAFLDGKKLEQINGAFLAWKLPANTSGSLLIAHDDGLRVGWLLLGAFSAVSVLVVLAPRRRNAYRDEWLDEA